MRELRVVGVSGDGTHVICQDVESGERYGVPSDERLRAAARGDISRLGQIEIEMQSALRPREIQARIRAGATVAEVATIAGVGVEKIERFAHPVLLERTRAAELAALAHPLRHDGPSPSSLGDIVGESLFAFGQNPNDAAWDAWKGEDGFWVVQIAWQVGHSTHHAHWRFHPGSHGGTATPLDELADELTHPELIQPRRRLTPVATPTAGGDRDAVTFDANALIGAQRDRHEDRPYELDFGGSDDGAEAQRAEAERAEAERTAAEVAAAAERARVEAERRMAAEAAAAAEARAAEIAELERREQEQEDAERAASEKAEAELAEAEQPGAEQPGAEQPEAEEIPDRTPTSAQAPVYRLADRRPTRARNDGADTDADTPDRDRVDTNGAAATNGPAEANGAAETNGSSDNADRAGDASATDDSTAADAADTVAADTVAADTVDESGTATEQADAKPRSRKSRKPQVPAWEDVLLGVRSNPHS